MMHKTLRLLLWLTPGLVMAGEPSAAARQEIAHLMHHLKGSGCAFSRNGSWYSSVDAAAHLNKKYDYLLQKGLVVTAEDFIARAGSASSMSGKAYQVKCANSPPVPSGPWLTNALAKFRSESH